MLKFSSSSLGSLLQWMHLPSLSLRNFLVACSLPQNLLTNIVLALSSCDSSISICCRISLMKSTISCWVPCYIISRFENSWKFTTDRHIFSSLEFLGTKEALNFRETVEQLQGSVYKTKIFFSDSSPELLISLRLAIFYFFFDIVTIEVIGVFFHSEVLSHMLGLNCLYWGY